MVGFTSYEIENDKEFAAQIKVAQSKVDDLSLAWRLIAKDFRTSNKAQFSLKGTGKYPPLSPRYELHKARTYGDKPILVRSGRLRDSVAGNTKTSDSIERITKTSLTFGTEVPYGIFHQSDDKRRLIPLRKFLFIGSEGKNDQDVNIGRLQRWVAILNSEVERKLKASF
ncbi:MAG: hypothetical protein KAJ39_08590 [Gammaproteobacteria bacterium]|nr:hypothetical protein [Gammaproteobacteria bacterium]